MNPTAALLEEVVDEGALVVRVPVLVGAEETVLVLVLV
jgi:hypothetical protein